MYASACSVGQLIQASHRARAHVVETLVKFGIGEGVGVNAEDLTDVDVRAVRVDLGIIRIQRRVGHAVHLLDPLARAETSSAYERVLALPASALVRRRPTGLAMGIAKEIKPTHLRQRCTALCSPRR